jgi:hypothetical protein
MTEPELKAVAGRTTVPEVLVMREGKTVSVEVKRLFCDGKPLEEVRFHPVTGKRLSRVWRFQNTDTVRRGLTKVKRELMDALCERAPQSHALLLAVPEHLSDKALRRLSLHVSLIARETPVHLPTEVHFVRCSQACFD